MSVGLSVHLVVGVDGWPSCKNTILEHVRTIYLKWQKKIKTSELNQWLHSDFLDVKVTQKWRSCL